MNKLIRASILAFALIAGFSPAFAQAPPPVPALPDAERRTSYVIAATTCICNVNFALYGDSTDYQSWVEVYLNGVRVNFNDGTFGWAITSPTGALGSIPRPVTDAVLTFNGVQTGTVQIVGARRPRRTSTFAENRGVAARDLNQILNDMIAQNRETWDKTNDVTGRALLSQPGNTVGLLPLPSACVNGFLGFDATGLNPLCRAGGAGSGNVVGPVTSVSGHAAVFNNATGTLLADGGKPPVNVTASPYLATGNGTTDDTAAIQAAATAACGTVGVAGSANTLYFPSGFYKITTTITIPCGLRVIGDGWAGDSGAAIQNQFITSNAGLSGSIIEPTSTTAGLTFVTNQAVTVRDIGIFYSTRPTASSGIAGITIQAAASATAPAALAWNVGSTVDHVWIYGADRDLLLVNVGSFVVSNNLFQMHQTAGIRIQGPNLPFAGDWLIANNTFWSGSIVNCAHVFIASGGGGRINGNKFNTCGSVNVIPPLVTAGVEWVPDLNVANNSLEPIVVTGNTIEGLSKCLWFFGGIVGQNSTATQMTITGNQMWCLENIRVDPTSTNGQWVSGGTISGNFMTSQTQAGISTTTSNLVLDGINNFSISGNVFNLLQGAGGDTSNAINLGAHTAGISQMANKAMANVTIPATVPLAMDGAGTGIATALGVNVGTAGAPVINGGALGTPSSGVGTNLTGTGASYTAGNATKLTTPRAIGIAGSTGLTATGVNFDGTAAINPALTGTLVVANGGTGDTGTAWASYTPSLSCGTATFATTSAKSKTMGKTTWAELDFTISTIGTCTTALTFALPNTPNSGGSMMGREISGTVNGIMCGFATATATCAHSPGAFGAGEHFTLSGVYENQ